MASPFNVFRKHQKVILVAAGVLCMFVFVIGDVLFQLVSTGGGGDGRTGADDLAVEWDGGQLTRLEMDHLEMRRNILRNFLNAVAQEGMMRAAGTQPDVRPLDVTRELYRPIQQEIVLRRLLAERAQEAGIVVSDAAINQYLSQLAQGQLSSEDLRSFVSGLEAGGRPVGMNYIFEAIREEMLADAYLDSYGQAVQTVTPAQRWEDWRKLNDRVVIESFAVPVGNFVDQVPDPTEDELRTFYEMYKNREPSPVLVQPLTELPSPDPAFRIPRKVEVHYIEADYQTVAQSIESGITGEEVEKYYEEHKNPRFIMPQLDVGVEGADDGTTEVPEGLPPEPSEVSEPPSAGQAAASPTSPGESIQDEPASTPDQNGTAPPASESGEATTPSPDDSSQGSLFDLPTGERTRYVAFLQDAAANPATEGAATDQQGALEAAGDVPPTETANPPAHDAAEESLTPPLSEGTDTTATASPAATGSEGLPPDPVEQTNVEYYPLDTVRDEIRRDIARERVEQKLQEIMPLIQSDLLTIYREYENWRLDAEDAGQDPDKIPRPEVNLQEIAEKHGLVAKQTVPLSFIELRETPLGKSALREGSTPYANYAFVQPLYEPAWTVRIPEDLMEQLQGGLTHYIALKVADIEADTPELAEIRDDVVRTYKQIKARDKALAEAQSLAKKANESGEPLTKQFAENEQLKPVESDPFSWYTSQFGSRFHLSKPFGVDHAGPDFFETVFSLEPGEAAATMNHDKSTAYVVQLARHQQSEDALRNRFLIEGHRVDRFPERGLLNALRISEQSFALEQSILAEAGVRWSPIPTPPTES